jgi:hypothetical protein
MRHLKRIVVFLLLLTGAQSGSAQCDSSLWHHVYNSYRLHVNTQCMTISGTVYSLIYEADGDIHIRVTLDSPYTYMLNASNYSGQYGKLVCEPLCATTCTQADAISSCAGFTNTVFIPTVGEHVLVTGSYVTDNDHGWNEIHPITSIVINNAVPQVNANAGAPEIKVYPNPATSFVNFSLSEKPTGIVYITISDAIGRLAGQYQMLEMTNLKVNTRYLPAGKYYYSVRQGEQQLKGGTFIVK